MFILELFILFFFINLLVGFCLLVNFAKYSLNAVVGLICFFVILGFFLIFLGFEYLGLLFIAVYSGAICVLFMFVVMLFGVKFKQASEFSSFEVVCVFSLLFFTNWRLCSLDVFYYVDSGYLGTFSIMPADGVSCLGVTLFNTHYHLLLLIGFFLFFITVGVTTLLLRCF